jgi:hypothetical protein
MAPVLTSFVEKATVARFVVEDFPLTETEQDALGEASARFALEDALREVVDFALVAGRAVELWRERRTR